jgi:hypothetical protein
MHGDIELPVNEMITMLLEAICRSLSNQSHGAVPPRNCGTSVVAGRSGPRYGAACSARESPTNTTVVGGDRDDVDDEHADAAPSRRATARAEREARRFRP